MSFIRFIKNPLGFVIFVFMILTLSVHLNANEIDKDKQRCEKGDGKACVEVAQYYEIKAKDYKNAYDFYGKACDNREEEICLSLADDYAHSKKDTIHSKAEYFVEIDYPKARIFNKKYCELKYNNYQDQVRCIGSMNYRYSNIKILKKLCDDGDNNFYYILGDNLMNREYRLPEDFAEAKNAYSKACFTKEESINQKLSCYQLGLIVSHLNKDEPGHSNDKYDDKLLDYTLVRDLFADTCDNKIAKIYSACYYLGLIYADNLAKKKSWLDTAFYYVKKACENGVERACIELIKKNR